MLMHGYERELSDFMFLNALLALGCAKGFYAAWFVIETDPHFKLEVTQRKRRFYLLLCQAILLATGGYMASFGPQSVWDNMNYWTHGVGPIGYILWGTTAFTFLSPLLTLMTLIHIYRRPSSLAYRLPSTWASRNGALFYKTDDIRAGRKQPIRVDKLGSGYSLKKFYAYV